MKKSFFSVVNPSVIKCLVIMVLLEMWYLYIPKLRKGCQQFFGSL
jgi:hypothetical protein